MKKILLVTAIILGINFVLTFAYHTAVKEGIKAQTSQQSTSQSNNFLSDPQIQSILEQVRQNDAANKQKQEAINAQKTAQIQSDTNKNNSYSVWTIAVFIIYLITILLLWIFMLYTMITMSRWINILKSSNKSS